MYLVDTSVWIDFLREKNNSKVKYFTEILEKKIPFGITGVIFQEILQGANSASDFNQLNAYLSTQRFYHPLNEIETSYFAAKIYFDCRRKGLTIRSSIDCLIAQIALENDLILLHNDNDFKLIQKVVTKLKLAPC